MGMDHDFNKEWFEGKKSQVADLMLETLLENIDCFRHSIPVLKSM